MTKSGRRIQSAKAGNSSPKAQKTSVYQIQDRCKQESHGEEYRLRELRPGGLGSSSLMKHERNLWWQTRRKRKPQSKKVSGSWSCSFAALLKYRTSARIVDPSRFSILIHFEAPLFLSKVCIPSKESHIRMKQEISSNLFLFPVIQIAFWRLNRFH